MKRPLKIALVLAYVALVLVLFKGVKVFERGAKEAWYTYVTKRMVSTTSHIPIDKCILGIYKPELPYSFGPLNELEDSLHNRFTLVSWYQAWGNKPEHQFQPALMDAVVGQGRVPVVTWEPWVTEFDAPHLKPVAHREHRYLRDIAGGVYDFYIEEWARAAVTWGKPFFLRFAHEMTNPQYPWSHVNDNRPEDYIRAWWHVHALFDSLGARNVIWVWCPYGTDVLKYYPGDTQVDWIAIDVFNYGDLLDEGTGMRWMTFDQLASPVYQELSVLKKPMMIAETGSSDMGGSREVWYREMLDQVASKFTNVKALIIFDDPSDRTSGRWIIDWSVGADPDVRNGMREGLANNRFIFIEQYHRLLGYTK
jgi:hypothetical protein